MVKGLLGNPMSCRDSPGLQKFRPGSTGKACSQTQDGQNLGGPRTRHCPGLASQRPDSSSLKTWLVSVLQELWKSKQQQRAAFHVKSRCSKSFPSPRPASVSYVTPRGTLCGQLTAPPEQSWVLLRRRQRGPIISSFSEVPGGRATEDFATGRTQGAAARLRGAALYVCSCPRHPRQVPDHSVLVKRGWPWIPNHSLHLQHLVRNLPVPSLC